ncbi:hypothetical protein [Ramlibacter sp.]|uniref:hypothetical protein n=1 Tax=Ramlibacter sp. TaxID=1917967 RepID=UPI003D10AC75
MIVQSALTMLATTAARGDDSPLDVRTWLQRGIEYIRDDLAQLTHEAGMRPLLHAFSARLQYMERLADQLPSGAAGHSALTRAIKRNCDSMFLRLNLHDPKQSRLILAIEKYLYQHLRRLAPDARAAAPIDRSLAEAADALEFAMYYGLSSQEAPIKHATSIDLALKELCGALAAGPNDVEESQAAQVAMSMATDMLESVRSAAQRSLLDSAVHRNIDFRLAASEVETAAEPLFLQFAKRLDRTPEDMRASVESERSELQSALSDMRRIADGAVSGWTDVHCATARSFKHACRLIADLFENGAHRPASSALVNRIAATLHSLGADAYSSSKCQFVPGVPPSRRTGDTMQYDAPILECALRILSLYRDLAGDVSSLRSAITELIETLWQMPPGGHDRESPTRAALAKSVNNVQEAYLRVIEAKPNGWPSVLSNAHAIAGLALTMSDLLRNNAQIVIPGSADHPLPQQAAADEAAADRYPVSERNPCCAIS